MGQLRILLSLFFAALGVAACTNDRNGPRSSTLPNFHVVPPDGNAVEVCHAYTCQMKSTFYFHPKDIAEIAALMRRRTSKTSTICLRPPTSPELARTWLF